MDWWQNQAAQSLVTTVTVATSSVYQTSRDVVPIPGLVTAILIDIFTLGADGQKKAVKGIAADMCNWNMQDFQ